MTLKQICLVIAVNLLAGTFLACRKHARASGGTSLILLAMILVGFAMMWRSII